jgi:thioredoxin 1
MSKQTITVTDANFEQEVLRSSKPVLVDFGAPWCGPCRMIAPILDQIASSETRVTIATLNVDENPRMSKTYDVMSLPTLILFHQGEPVGKIVGFRPKAELLRILDQAVEKLTPAAK